ncbi:MAG: heparinase II/III family protein [Gemmatimonadota bacterium]|nr:MAG: heparinase II/III family protein [Gemmatimonadota bacterium]
MMLLNSVRSIVQRGDQIRECPELQSLASRLRRLAQPLRGTVYIPEQKAMLTREGGACPADSARLLFDPLSPHAHTCPKCGGVFNGERHHWAWIWRYHIWLSERAVHLALLGTLEDDGALRGKAFQILDNYSRLYGGYPNRDNVLGPTRLFFSTYLESIWLLQLIIAAMLLESSIAESEKTDTHDWTAFDQMVDESAGLVASFDEGWSNRQVWNNAALLAVGLWLGQSDQKAQNLIAHAMDGPHGIRPQLVTAVSGEGLWYEGENYHFFALRGFLLAAELARLMGLDLYQADGPAGRLQDMYVAPLSTVLPDLTLPARGDSPYGVSLLQPRFAELWEVGWARTGDERIGSILSHLYSAEAPEGDDTGLSELAEQEQNRPAKKLQRHLLGWKALCWMTAVQPSTTTDVWRGSSTILAGAGVAVIRPSPHRYVSVECGGNPGGHGHPDLLHLTIWWDRPVLTDFGTASYVTPSLHWYRSTLAHNAPGVSGQGQVARSAWCQAFDHVGDWAWCRAVADGLLGPGTSVTRTVVVGPDCIIDQVEISASDDVSVDLPIHPIEADHLASELQPRLEPVDVAGLGEVSKVSLAGDLRLVAGNTDLVLGARGGESIYCIEELGPPDDQFADGVPLSFLVRRASGSGTWLQCYLPNSDKAARVVHQNGSVIIEHGDGSEDRIALTKRGCRVVDRDGDKHHLAAVRERPVKPKPPVMRRRRLRCPIVEPMPSLSSWRELVPQDALINLGKSHYRRSEEPYGARGAFRAQASVFVSGTHLCFVCDVSKPELHFRLPDTPDPRLDNETPDIHSDGLQCYIGLDEWCGFLVVPVPESDVIRVSPVAGTPADCCKVSGWWEPTKKGYRVLVAVDVGHSLKLGDEFPVNLVVNEMYADRARRMGQLVLSGGGGWVYLRGDREPSGSAVIAEVM